MSPEAWDAVGFTPAGQDTYGRFMRIRVFDQWMHELDIRDAIGLGGGDEGLAAEVGPPCESTSSGGSSPSGAVKSGLVGG